MSIEQVGLSVNMSTQTPAQFSHEPLGVGPDLRRRLLLHHLPLALASAAVFVLFRNSPYKYGRQFGVKTPNARLQSQQLHRIIGRGIGEW